MDNSQVNFHHRVRNGIHQDASGDLPAARASPGRSCTRTGGRTSATASRTPPPIRTNGCGTPPSTPWPGPVWATDAASSSSARCWAASWTAGWCRTCAMARCRRRPGWDRLPSASSITQPPMFGHAVAELLAVRFRGPGEDRARATRALRWLLDTAAGRQRADLHRASLGGRQRPRASLGRVGRAGHHSGHLRPGGALTVEQRPDAGRGHRRRTGRRWARAGSWSARPPSTPTSPSTPASWAPPWTTPTCCGMPTSWPG